MSLPACPCCRSEAQALSEGYLRCPGCAHVWHCRPVPARHYEQLSGRNAGFAHLADKFDARLATLAPLLADGQRILEIGCAEGGLGALIKSRYPLYYAGIELSGDADTAAGALDQVWRCPAGEITDTTGFDLVLAFHVLEHLPDPVNTLREWSRLAAPHARLIIEVPHGSGHPDLPLDRHPEHLHQFSAASLALALQHAGLSLIRLSSGHFESAVYPDCLYAEALLTPDESLRKARLLARFADRIGKPFLVYGTGGDFINYVAPFLDDLPVLGLFDSAAGQHGRYFSRHCVGAFSAGDWPDQPILIASTRHGSAIRAQLIASGIAPTRLHLLEDVYG